MRASNDPLVRQFVRGEADGPVAYQHPSRNFSEELDLV
jgi:ABC-type transporter Mla maintaining outer membrane lipid asymmetry ATPase subunit MlaF